MKKGFIIKGRAENVETVFNKLKFYLHPFLLAGIKGKLLESMQFGLPNVTSAVGAKKMHETMTGMVLLPIMKTEFVEKAVLLYKMKIFGKSQENGSKL